MLALRHFFAGTSGVFRIVLTLSLLVIATNAWTDDFTQNGRFYQQLSSPLNLVLRGKSFRESAQQVADQGGVNLWISRHVDPTSPISPGQIGPNVLSALAQIAEQRQCVVMPVANVVLMGPEKWVDATATALISTSPTVARQSVTWDEITTPREALAKATETPVASTLALPHDLWPAVSLKNVAKPVVVNLILSQFGRRMASSNKVDLKKIVPLESRSNVTRRYTDNDVFRTAVARLGSGVNTKTKNGIATLSLTARQHRLLSVDMIASAAKSEPTLEIDKRMIESFKIQQATAGSILNQLAAYAKMTCTFSPTAQTTAQSVIDVEVNNKSLKQVIEIVAEKAGLRIEWSEDSFEVR